MKTHILFLVLPFVFYSSLFSQTFEKTIRTSEDDLSFDAIELDDGGFILAYNRGAYNVDTYGGLLRFDASGEYTDSIFFRDYQGFIEGGISDIINLTDGSLICMRSMKNTTTDDRQTNLVHITKEFEILFDTIYGLPNISESTFGRILSSDDKLISVGRIEGTQTDLFIGEFDLLKKTYRFQAVSGYPAFVLSSLMEIPEKNAYHIYLMYDNNKTYLKVDKETLSVDSVLYYPGNFIPRDAIKGIDSSSYYVVGTSNIGSGIYKPAIIEVNSDGEILHYHEYIDHPDTTIYYAYNSFDYKYGKMYFGVTYNFTDPLAFPYQYQHSWLLIYKLKANGDVIWQRFYYGDVNYNTYKVLATNDGGALITATRYDWNDPLGTNLDLHILKIDSTGWYEGLPVGTGEFDQQKQILAYPNPTRDWVHFEPGLYNDLQLTLYNQNSREIHTQALPSHTSIDLSGYPAGVYIYVIQNQKGFLEKGKLIKE